MFRLSGVIIRSLFKQYVVISSGCVHFWDRKMYYSDKRFWRCSCIFVCFIQGDSVARGPKLLSIKNDVIEIMT